MATGTASGDAPEPVAALAEQQAELRALVEPLDGAGLERPSRCDGWTIADVLLHLAQTNEMAVASASGRLADVVGDPSNPWAATPGDVDAMAGGAVEAERTDPIGMRDRWLASADAQVAAFEAADPHARVLWVAGDMAARTLATTRLSETWIHTGDVAEPLGVPTVVTDRLRLVARLAWRTLPYAFRRAGLDEPGPVAFRLRGPAGAEWDLEPDGPAATVVRGDALELCLVAGQRRDAADTSLVAEGPDAEAVLRLVRTFA